MPTQTAATGANASLRVQASITAKREGRLLTEPEIAGVVGDFVAGRIPDYQMAAWLATVACRGLNLDETAALTRAYIDGGDRLDLTRVGRPVVDKHSTGGVGDKATLVVTPIVAACGVRMVKMSGRGLGHAGGTIDKLESIPGLRLDLNTDEVYSVVDQTGMVITGQSSSLAPGDGATYALRDVTATVEDIPLIAASIISKKVAVGADGLVLDVKTGEGALIRGQDGARALAQTMVALARRFGLRSQAILTDMSEPMGRAVGNALEVKAALNVLRGEEVPGLSAPCRVLARALLQSADPNLSGIEADQRINRVLKNGEAHDRFIHWATVQGAEPHVLEEPDRLPTAPCVTPVFASRDGWVHRVTPRAIGSAAVRVGAGRLSARAPLDHAAGLVVHHRVGDRVDAGDVLVEIHHSWGNINAAVQEATQAFVIGDEPCPPTTQVHEVIT